MYIVAFYYHFQTQLAETFRRRYCMPLFRIFLTFFLGGHYNDVITPILPSRDIRNNLLGLHNIRIALTG